MAHRRQSRVRAKATVRQPSERAPIFAKVPPIAIAAAGLLTLACVAPLILWGNPYPDGVVQYWMWGTVGTLLVAVAASLLPTPALRDLPRSSAKALTRLSPRGFAGLLASVTTALALMFAIYVFHRAASTSDEIAQLWHAKILLHGRMSLPVDPNREFFALETVVDVRRWYSQFPIGGPLMAVPGALLGAPWLLNPILAGIAVVAMYHFARHAYGETQGRAIAALFSVTPMMLLMAGTWMNHVPVLLLTTCTLAALVKWERASTSRRALAYSAGIGLALGAMATIRPLDALVVAAAVGCFQLWAMRGHWHRAGELVLQTVCGTIGVAPLLYANRATTGSALRFGYEVLWGTGHRVGFHTDPYGVNHTLGRAFEYAITYVSELNMSLLAWPVPAMVIVLIGLLTMRKATRWDALVLGLFGAQVVAYASYWYAGEFLGPRFLYTALPAIIVLVARTPFLVVERFGPRWRRGAVAFTVSCLVVAWCAPGLSFNVWGLARHDRAVRQTLRVDIAGTVRAANVHHALVLLHEPFSSRLARRLWGLGLTRSEAAQLIASRDACSLLSAIRIAEVGGLMRRTITATGLAQAADPFVSSDQPVRTGDRGIHISSPASINPPCRAEMEADARLGSVAFGPALLLEPIDNNGRIDGDIIYVADLGERNAVLRSRFGDRVWYRLIVHDAEDGQLRATLTEY
jgi:hypothetical protein